MSMTEQIQAVARKRSKRMEWIALLIAMIAVFILTMWMIGDWHK